jgi:hypothetical protein
LDNVKESFEKERKLIQMEAEKKAQEAYQAQQQEIFQKQLELMDKWQQQGGGGNGGSGTQVAPAMFQTVQPPPPVSDEPPSPDIIAPSPSPEEMMKSTASGTTTTTSKTTTKKDNHPWTNTGSNEQAKSVKATNNNEATSNGTFQESMDGTLVNSTGMDFDINDSDDDDSHKPPSAPPPTPSEKQEQPTDLKSTNTHESASSSAKSRKEEINPANPSNRFTPVYVAPSQPNQVAREEPVEDDGITIGQTVASSTYGEDRIKVIQKELLDPYGDKGVYTGVVLRTTGMPHGLGRMIYEEDGRIYEGDW